MASKHWNRKFQARQKGRALLRNVDTACLCEKWSDACLRSPLDQDGLNLQFASTELQGDRKMVVQALGQDGLALRHVRAIGGGAKNCEAQFRANRSHVMKIRVFLRITGPSKLRYGRAPRDTTGKKIQCWCGFGDFGWQGFGVIFFHG